MGQASDTYAQITRDQYADWLERFYPSQTELLETTQKTDLLDQQISNSNINLASASQAAKTANTNQLARYGLSDSSQGVDNAKTQLAKVSSTNSLREYESDRAISTLTGSDAALGTKSTEL